MTDYPLLVKGKAYKIKPTTAEVLATYHYPADNFTRATSIFTTVSSPRVKNSGDPAITINKYGKGRVVFIGCNFGDGELVRPRQRQYEIAHAYPKQIVDNIITLLLKDGKTVLTNAPAGVEIIVNKQDRRYIVHLINNYNIPVLFLRYAEGNDKAVEDMGQDQRKLPGR